VSTEDVLTGLNEWVLAVCTPTIVGAYPFLPAEKPLAFPDVVAEVLDIRLTVDDPAFPFSVIQQTWLKVWQVGLSIMVSNADPEAAASQLEGYADQMDASIRSDGSLGGRVPFISPYYSFDFTAPFVEYNDGTRGREMNVQISVGELVEAPA